jgi:hypothetical protein
MRKMNFYKYLVVILGILALFPRELNAQNPTPNLYSVHVKQSFSSWGSCSSDPDFDYADITLIFNNAPSLLRRIRSNELTQTIEFDDVFTNSQQDKNLLYLFGESNSSIHKIHVHTNANDIKNDHDLYYELRMDELVVGEYSESHDASDPCNNIISSNREGYTMTTTVYIDDPIYITYTGSNSYNLDFERVGLRIDGYYENRHANKPFLQVALDSDPDNWIDLKHITIKPNNTLNLSYKDIVGEKNANNPRYFDWMGKSLRFRVIKTLKNNELTTGNIVTSIRFYPDGLQYTIEEITRTNCDENVRVYVELENDADTGFLNLDTDQYYWVAFDGVTGFDCEMVPQGGLRFEIILDLGGLPGDPFDEPNTEDMVWTLQLQEKDKPGFIACERNFTIPEKPGIITIDQKPKSSPVNGVMYNLPSMSNPYALLNIVDDYTHSALRRPYTITGPNDFEVLINDIPTAYDDLSQEGKNDLDTAFKYHFLSITDDFNAYDNPYSSYFSYRYKEWFKDQNAASPFYRIIHPNGVSQFFVSKYHSHYHTHSCTHSHTHTHYCYCIPGKKMSDTPKINNTQKYPNCPQGYTMECHEDDHSLANPDPHNLCSHTSHTVESNADWSQPDNGDHTHTEGHSHIHTNTGIHAHGANSNYDYILIKKLNLSNDNVSNFSTTYNNVDYITLTTTGFKAEYTLRRSGVDIPVTIWTEDAILNSVYPDKGVAQTWYDDYYAIYKEQWLEEQLGTKLPIPDTMVNQLPEGSVQNLILTDYHGCDYNFYIDVDAPPSASFTISNKNEPSEACKNDGSATITYNGGGVPPYKHAAGDLNDPGDQIIVTNLIYGPNPIKFHDAEGYESETIIVPINGAVGITSTPVSHQTCTPANGRITVNVGSVSGTKTYTLTNVYTDEKYVQTLSANTYVFDNLPTGIYNAKVENNTCPSFYKPGIEIENHIFQVTDIPTDATTIGGNGSVAISFDNRINNVTWTNAPATFSTASSNNKNYQVAPDNYNIIATHIDQYGAGCDVPVDFEIKAPTFSATVNIEETEDNATVSVSLTGSDLIDDYHFRLLNSSGSEVNPPVVQTDGVYTVNMVYDGNNIDVFEFTYPSTKITSGYYIKDTDSIRCPGGDGTVTLAPSGGREGANFTISTDGIQYFSTTEHTVHAGVFKYYIKEETYPTGNKNIYDNSLTIKHTLINSFSDTIADAKQITANVESIDITCAGLNNGRVSLNNLSNGSGSYKYRIDSDGDWTNTLLEIPDLTPGNHDVYIQDIGYGCQAFILTSFPILEPDTLKLDSIRIVQPKCELDNGEIYVQASGGNGLYKFDWEYNNSFFHSTDSLVEDSIIHFPDSLAYGSYKLILTDFKDGSMGCQFDTTLILNEYENPKIISFDSTDVSCYMGSDGEILITETLGTTSINNIGIIGVDLVYNDFITNISNPFDNLSKGTYNLIATDDSLCTSDTVEITISQPDSLYLDIETIVPVIQKGENSGEIHFTVHGGNGNLKTVYLLNSEKAIIDEIDARNNSLVRFYKLYKGDYSIEVTDEKGCSYTSQEISVEEPEHTLGFNVIDKYDAQCKAQTGGFTIQAFGGWGEYSYNKASSNGFSNDSIFNKLNAGSYLISIKDKHGAIFTDTVKVYEPQDSLQASLVSFIDPTCNNNGSLTINIKGGVAPYSVNFDESGSTSISAPQNYTFTNRSSGSSTLHIVDDNGCKFEMQTNLSDQDLISINNFQKTYPTGTATHDGEIEAFVSGGMPPINYTWSELNGSIVGGNSSVLSGISFGHYKLHASEQNGCFDTSLVYLPSIYDQVIELIDIQHETNYQENDGYVHLFSDLESIDSIKIIDPHELTT